MASDDRMQPAAELSPCAWNAAIGWPVSISIHRSRSIAKFGRILADPRKSAPDRPKGGKPAGPRELPAHC
jgi:hypothetical protein